MTKKTKFSLLAMQLRRPQRKHSNTAFIQNFVRRTLGSARTPMTAEQIRQQGIKLAQDFST